MGHWVGHFRESQFLYLSERDGSKSSLRKVGGVLEAHNSWGWGMSKKTILSGVLTFLVGLTAQAAITLPGGTLFTLHRSNYKPQKTLIYQAHSDGQICQFDVKNPLEVYYLVDEKGTVTRETMSADSQKYFGPTVNAATLTPSSFEFTFSALQEAAILPVADRKLRAVVTTAAGGACGAPEAYIRYKAADHKLSNIEIQISKVFGIPTGVDWVNMTILDSDGKPKTICLQGSCR